MGGKEIMMYEPIKERNILIYVFLFPAVSLVVSIIGYVAIFAAAAGMEASYYYDSAAAAAGLGAGSIILAICLSLVIVAAGIYFVVIWCGVSRDINTMCAGDPQSTPLMVFAGAYCIGAFVPFGIIYFMYYLYKMQDKMQRNAYRYNANVTWSPVAVLLFAIFINIVAFAILLSSFNEMARAYNASLGTGYNSDDAYGNNAGNNAREEFAQDFMSPLQDVGIGGTRQGLLRCMTGEIAGASIIMNNGDSLVLGRDPQSANVVLREDKKVSRRHCAVTYRNGTFYITDFSSNGTRLANGLKLETGKETNIGSQAEFRVSEQTSFTVQIKPN